MAREVKVQTRRTTPSIRAWPRAWILLAACALAGCASVPTPPTTAPTPAPAPSPAPAPPRPTPDGRAALPAALKTERQWLDSWFHGTPVLIAQRSDGALLVDVPREFCFDPGRSQVKPALAAVLDKVAQTLRRRPDAHVALMAAPGDDAKATALALQRAAQVNKHLRTRGVPAARLGPPSVTTAAAVQLRIGPAPQ